MQVLNLGSEDFWLLPKIRLGVLSQGYHVESGLCDVVFQWISRDHEEVMVSLRSMTETQSAARGNS